MKGILVGIVMLIGGALTETAMAEPLTSCDQTQRVEYTSPEVIDLAAQVKLEQGRTTPNGAGQQVAVLSPHKTASYSITYKPNFSRPGPWNTVVEIQGTNSHPVNMLLTVLDHGNNDVSLTWLNEHLLFVHVWWGRLVDGHLIVDIDEGKVIHAEEGHYHTMVETCG